MIAFIIIIIGLSWTLVHVLLEHMKLDIEQDKDYFDQYLEDMRMIRSRLWQATSAQEVEQIHLEIIKIRRSYDLWVESRC